MLAFALILTCNTALCWGLPELNDVPLAEHARALGVEVRYAHNTVQLRQDTTYVFSHFPDSVRESIRTRDTHPLGVHAKFSIHEIY